MLEVLPCEGSATFPRDVKQYISNAPCYGIRILKNSDLTPCQLARKREVISKNHGHTLTIETLS